MKGNHLHKKLVALLFIPLFYSSGLSGQKDNSISTVASQYMYPFSFNQSFQGEGWEMIKDLADKHKYFLIGEDHGLAEIPLFTKELIHHINYDLFVTEIDSVTASMAKEIASQASAQIDAFHSQNPSVLSFYSAKEEFEIIEELAKSDADIWGLDQVSLFSTGIVFRRLSEVCSSKEAKELSSELATLSDNLFHEATQTGNYDTLLIYSSKRELFDKLRLVLKNESQEAKSLFQDIETSWKIYNRIDGANYTTRIKGMKSKLLNYYLRQASNQKKYKKILYKFGAYHVGKAENIIKGYDVGNFVSNIAEAEGASSYHLMIIGKKGTMNTFLLAEGMESVSYDINNKNSELHDLLPLADLVDEKNWAFFDLRPLRALMSKGNLTVDDSFLRNTIKSYDGLVIIPETTRSEIIKP